MLASVKAPIISNEWNTKFHEEWVTKSWMSNKRNILVASFWTRPEMAPQLLSSWGIFWKIWSNSLKACIPVVSLPRFHKSYHIIAVLLLTCSQLTSHYARTDQSWLMNPIVNPDQKSTISCSIEGVGGSPLVYASEFS